MSKGVLGQIFVITGILPSMERAEAEKLIIEHGGRIGTYVGEHADYLIVGDNPGSRYAKAVASYPDLPRLNEMELLALLDANKEGTCKDCGLKKAIKHFPLNSHRTKQVRDLQCKLCDLFRTRIAIEHRISVQKILEDYHPKRTLKDFFPDLPIRDFALGQFVELPSICLVHYFKNCTEKIEIKLTAPVWWDSRDTTQRWLDHCWRVVREFEEQL